VPPLDATRSHRAPNDVDGPRSVSGRECRRRSVRRRRRLYCSSRTGLIGESCRDCGRARKISLNCSRSSSVPSSRKARRSCSVMMSGRFRSQSLLRSQFSGEFSSRRFLASLGSVVLPRWACGTVCLGREAGAKASWLQRAAGGPGGKDPLRNLTSTQSRGCKATVQPLPIAGPGEARYFTLNQGVQFGLPNAKE